MNQSIDTASGAATPGKSMAIAYLLWFFLGGIGIHRLYLEKKGTAAAQMALLVIGLVLSVVLIGLPFLIALGIWWLCDAFFVQAIVTDYNRQHGLADPGLSVVPGQTMQTRQTDDLEVLERLNVLREKGALSEQEYESRKAKLNIG